MPLSTFHILCIFENVLICAILSPFLGGYRLYGEHCSTC